MKPIIPLSAIIIYALLLILISTGLLPDPIMISEYIKNLDSAIIYYILFIIILLESIIYIGFYLP
jgi:membrane-associated protein